MTNRPLIIFYLNGTRHQVGAEQARLMLSDYLRYECRLTGTKVVCAEGDCGACSVLRLFPLSPLSENKNLYLPINSCIVTVAQMDGSSLVTVDALSESGALTPVQNAMLESNGSQCGFCTPGFVVAMTGLVEKRLCRGVKKGERCSSQEVKNALTGNLCRCTGYQPIIDAARAIDLAACASVRERFYSGAQAKELKKALAAPVFMENENFSFYAPRTLKEAARYLFKNRDARLVGAATDLGVIHNKGKIKLSKLVSLHLIPELYKASKKKSRASIGARVTLSELRYFIREQSPEFARFLNLFASPQIKNNATLVGNIGNASPIADTPPFLLVSNASLTVVGPKGKRAIPLERFYLGYRKTALKPGELIASVEFDLSGKNQSVGLYKASQRKDLDISAVNAAFHIDWADAKKTRIKTARVAMGGVAATPLRLSKTEKFLNGKILNAETLSKAATQLRAEMSPLSDLRGSAAYRRVLVENFFHRFFREHGGSTA